MKYETPEVFIYDEKIMEEIAFFAGPNCGPPFSQCGNRHSTIPFGP